MGEFADYETAEALCRTIVERSLRHHLEPGMTAGDLLVHGQVFATLAASSDVGLDGRIVTQRHSLLSADAELLGKVVRALGRRCGRRERPGDLTFGVLDAGRHDGPE